MRSRRGCSSNADNLVSNHIYRDGQSITTAENRNRRIKCRYFSDIRPGKQLQSLGVSDMKRWWRIFGGEMSVRTSLATRRGAQIFGPPRTPLVQRTVLVSTEESRYWKAKKNSGFNQSGEQYEDTYVSVISWRMQKKSGTEEYDGVWMYWYGQL